MQFLNSSQNVPYGRSNLISQSNVPNMFKMRQLIPQQKSVEEVKLETAVEVKRMLWGPAIWFLFHTLAEKIREEVFSSIKVELLNNIYSISINLPCPMCATHAKEYLDKINFNRIQTKSDLKNLFFEFHNHVNKEKNLPIFSREELDEKYSKANTVNIIHNFMYHFQDRYRSPKLIANDLQRSRIAIVLKDWFSRNISNFNP